MSIRVTSEFRSHIVHLDRNHVWRPYTSSEDHERRDPLVVVRAEGPYLHDADGRRYIDANGSWWCNTLGHGHPRLREALLRQSETLMHCSLAGITHEPAAALAAELIAECPPGLSRVFFSDNGSTAVEAAAKIAFQFFAQNGQPARRRFVTLDGGFHGDTVGAMSLSGVDAFGAVFRPLQFEAWRAPVPEAGGFEVAVEWIESRLAIQGSTVAGVIVEPLIQGASGMRMYTSEQLARIARATEEAGALLITDEVFTGFGRTGEMWASTHAGVVPDLMCIAKGFSGGVLPFAATVASDHVYEGFRGGKDRALLHGHTFCGNPLGASVAREVLAVYRDEDVLGQVREKAPRVRQAFSQLEGVSAWRTLGLVGAADLSRDGYHATRGWEVYEAARKRGVYLRPLGDTVYICPPLTIPVEVLDELLDVVRESIAAVTFARKN